MPDAKKQHRTLLPINQKSQEASFWNMNHNAVITFLSELDLSHQRFIQLVQIAQNFDDKYAHQFQRTYPQNSKTVAEAARLKISSYGMFVG